MLRDHRFGTHYGNKVKEDILQRGGFFLNFYQVTLKSVAEMRNVDSEPDKKYASYTQRWQHLDTVGETEK